MSDSNKFSNDDYLDNLEASNLEDTGIYDFYSPEKCTPEIRKIAIDYSSGRRGRANEEFVSKWINSWGFRLHMGLTCGYDFDIIRGHKAHPELSEEECRVLSRRFWRPKGKHVVAATRAECTEKNYQVKDLHSKRDFDIGLWVYTGTKLFPDYLTECKSTQGIRIESKTSLIRSIDKHDRPKFQVSSYKPALNDVLWFTNVYQDVVKHWYTSSQNVQTFLKLNKSKPNKCPDGWSFGNKVTDEFTLNIDDEGAFIYTEGNIDYSQLCNFDNLIECDGSMESWAKFITFCAKLKKRNAKKRFYNTIDRADYVSQKVKDSKELSLT